jgi:hypothetical protein
VARPRSPFPTSQTLFPSAIGKSDRQHCRQRRQSKAEATNPQTRTCQTFCASPAAAGRPIPTFFNDPKIEQDYLLLAFAATAALRAPAIPNDRIEIARYRRDIGDRLIAGEHERVAQLGFFDPVAEQSVNYDHPELREERRVFDVPLCG